MPSRLEPMDEKHRRRLNILWTCHVLEGGDLPDNSSSRQSSNGMQHQIPRPGHKTRISWSPRNWRTAWHGDVNAGLSIEAVNGVDESVGVGAFDFQNRGQGDGAMVVVRLEGSIFNITG